MASTYLPIEHPRSRGIGSSALPILKFPGPVEFTLRLPRGTDMSKPTLACPGSLEKVAVLQRRWARQLPMHVDGDSLEMDGRVLIGRDIETDQDTEGADPAENRMFSCTTPDGEFEDGDGD